MSAINSILCIDCSGSMSGSPLVSAISDATYFTAIQNTTDSVGLVSFDTTATEVASLQAMTTTNKLALFGDLSGLSTKGITNIQAALNDANTMLGTASPSGIVLLTDGYANTGTVPPVAPTDSSPIYPIGLGYSVNTTNLQSLATNTSGTYYSSPTKADLSQMYNDIAGQMDIAALLTNTQGSASKVVVMGTTVVSEGAASVKIGATWTNSALQYTSGTPSGAELTLLIQCPNGGHMPVEPTYKGTGYVLYEIQNPTAGTYSSYLYTPSTNNTSGTIGAFDPSLTARLNYEVPHEAKVGQPMSVKCYVSDEDGSPVHHWSLSGVAESPIADVQTVLQNHREELDDLDIDTGDEPEEVTDNQRMLALEKLRGPDQPLIPRLPNPLSITHGKSENHFSFTPEVAGTHMVTIRGEGHAPVAGRGFNLVRVIPITVS